METVRSRQNKIIRYFISLGADGDCRRASGEYLCAGGKLLHEAEKSGAEVTCVLWTDTWPGIPTLTVTPEILDYVSPLKNGGGPVFSVKMRREPADRPRCAIVLENVQDPGNVGTVLRTADAFGIDLVALCGTCADPYSPKTVRASMGAIFRQSIALCTADTLPAALGGLPMYGAALHTDSRDIRSLPAGGKAIAVGNEGRGLTEKLLSLCEGTVVIPMRPCAESLNAGVAAAVAMWEMKREWRG